MTKKIAQENNLKTSPSKLQVESEKRYGVENLSSKNPTSTKASPVDKEQKSLSQSLNNNGIK